MFQFRFSSPSELLSVLYYLSSFDDALRFRYTIQIELDSANSALTQSSRLTLSTAAIPPFCYTVVELQNTPLIPAPSATGMSGSSGDGPAGSSWDAAMGSADIPLPEMEEGQRQRQRDEGEPAMGEADTAMGSQYDAHTAEQVEVRRRRQRRWSTSWVVSGGRLIAAVRALHEGEAFALQVPTATDPLALLQHQPGKYTHLFQLHTLYDLGPRLELDHGTLYFYAIKDIDGFRAMTRSLSTCPLEFADIALRWGSTEFLDKVCADTEAEDYYCEGPPTHSRRRLDASDDRSPHTSLRTVEEEEGVRRVGDSRVPSAEEDCLVSPEYRYRGSGSGISLDSTSTRASAGSSAATASASTRLSPPISSSLSCALRIESDSVATTLHMGRVPAAVMSMMGSLRCGDAVSFGSLLSSIHQRDRFCRLSVGFGGEGLAAFELQWCSLMGEHSAKLYFCAA